MKRVYLDFDDVLAETFRELARFAREAFGRTPPPGKSVHFDLHESLGLTDAEYGVFMERFHAERLRAVDEIPGATAAVLPAAGNKPLPLKGGVAVLDFQPWQLVAVRAK